MLEDEPGDDEYCEYDDDEGNESLGPKRSAIDDEGDEEREEDDEDCFDEVFFSILNKDGTEKILKSKEPLISLSNQTKLTIKTAAEL